MTRIAAGFLLSLFTGVVVQNPPAFRSTANAVTIDVGVRQGGRPVTGLTAADFELTDNGVPQRISQLSYETLPIDVIVALDVSESVNGSLLDQLRRAVQELTRDLTPKDRLRLLTFNVRINRLIDFNAGPGAIDAAFNGIRPFGPTAVRDTIAVALTTPAQPDRRQLVVVFSDGDDRSSVTTEQMLLDVVRHTTPTLGLVLTPSLSPAASRTAKVYTDLANETGGFVEVAETDRSLAGAFRKVLTDFRRSYVLYFVPEGVARSGSHRIEVRVKRSGAEVHARKTYSVK